MTTSPYSTDLRKKVINYIKKGNSKKSASEVFSLHRNTVSGWWTRYKIEGSSCAKPRIGARRRLNLEALVKFVKSNPNSTLFDMASKFNATSAWLSICLRKLGFSYKKKPSPMWKQVKKSEKSTRKL
jgi:transposase